MIYCETHNGLRDAKRTPCTRVVVYDEFNNPLCFVVDAGQGIKYVVKCDDPDFNRLLQELGIAKTIVVQNLHQTPLDQIRFDG